MAIRMLGVLFLIVLTLSCAPPGYGPPPARDGAGQIEEGRFGGFPLPPSLETKWLAYWNQQKLLYELMSNRTLSEQEQIDDQRTPDFGWPESWKDFNAGDSGLLEIPPWAWEPSNDESLPTYCFLPLDLGNSTGIGSEVCVAEVRYAYNAFLKNCLPFNYLGCAGNTNNFISIELCTEQCMPHPSQGGCDPNVMQFISTLSDLDEQWGDDAE